MRIKTVIGGIALLLAAPVRFTPATNAQGSIVVEFNDAQCQATECMSWPGRICSMSDVDWIDFKCQAGCAIGDE